MTIEGSSKRLREEEDWQIKFSLLDTKIVEDNGNDPIAIFVVINTFLVEKILVDDGSVVEVLMWKAFKEMNLDESLLRSTGPIYDFVNQLIRAKVIITLPVILRQGEHTMTMMADFLVIDQPLAYNTIIGRPLMKKTSMVTAVYCMTIKFLTPTRIGYVKVDQATTRQCHNQSLQLSRQAISEPDKVVTRDVLAIKRDGSTITLDNLDPKEDYLKPEPFERIVEVQIKGEG